MLKYVMYKIRDIDYINLCPCQANAPYQIKTCIISVAQNSPQLSLRSRHPPSKMHMQSMFRQFSPHREVKSHDTALNAFMKTCNQPL